MVTIIATSPAVTSDQIWQCCEMSQAGMFIVIQNRYLEVPLLILLCVLWCKTVFFITTRGGNTGNIMKQISRCDIKT